MKSNKILQVVSDKKNGQRMALDRDGNLWCQKAEEKWEEVAFNKIYSSYYPKCFFTQLLYCYSGFVASGETEEGDPVAFQSFSGNVWNQLQLCAVRPFGKTVCVTGKIKKILCLSLIHI